MSRARIFVREARSILTPTGGYLEGYSHTLQPYSGCEFSCVYCYVREMMPQRTSPQGLAWSRWIAPKRNAPELLAREAERGRLSGARIFCSSVTDPYTPLERRLGLTRGCLEVLARTPPAALVVQTRSPLVARDARLLARIPTAGVSMTVATDDEAVRRAFEPNAPGTGLRIEALGRLRAAGVPTQAAVAPLLPGDPTRLARRLDPVVDRVVVDDVFLGDGAGGRRSGPALRRLADAGHVEHTRPGAAEAALDAFRAVLGPERVAFSQEGFNQLGWLAPR
jgi:DNA repair photolyase